MILRRKIFIFGTAAATAAMMAAACSDDAGQETNSDDSEGPPDTDTDGDTAGDTDGDTDTDTDGDGDGDGDGDSDSDADGDVTFTISSTQAVHRISPFIYGSNQLSAKTPHLRLGRSGGNRWTAYNWETNASNAGSDWYYHSDNYLSDSDVPGEAVREGVAESQSVGAAHIVTLPMAGYVAADEDGNVDLDDPNHIADRFFPTLPAKGATLSLSPDKTDDVVYQDEFVNWLDNEFPGAMTDTEAPIFLCLDNEPALWAYTHEEIHPDPVTYAELSEKSIALATAVKNVVPDATVMGFVGYGWAAFEDLQGAPDADGNFIEYFLDAMKQADEDAGMRLVDVLDLHWYPEASANDVRIVEADNSAAVAEARMQAPRSLWDDTYTEESWITKWSTNGPIELIPLMKSRIDAHYPGTKLSISEYNFGGPDHISGAIAEADALGIFGREDIFAAALWPLSDTQPFTMAGFDMYRNFDGNGGAFGDTSISAKTSDAAATSVYASVNEGVDDEMIIVAINKTDAPVSADIRIDHGTDFTSVEVYQLTDAETSSVSVDDEPEISNNQLVYEMPAQSVSTLALRK